MNSFAITLNCHPKKCLNKGVNKFYMLLPEKISLVGDYEVGLSEIKFTNNVFNVEYPEYITILSHNGFQLLDNPIQPGLYNMDELFRMTNEIVEDYFKEVTKQIPIKKDVLVKYQTLVTPGGVKYTSKQYKDIPEYFFNQIPHFIKKNNKWFMEIGISSKRDFFVILPSRNLCKLIGFDYNEIVLDTFVKLENFNPDWTNQQKDDYLEKEKRFDQKYPHKMSEKLNSFYVCSDIAEPIIYGENFKPILRYINFDKMSIDQKYHMIFKHPHFLKVRKNPFERIEIKLFKKLHFFTDVDSMEIPYWMRYGEIEITLQFRKISDYPRNYEKEIPKYLKKKVDTSFDTVKFDPDDPPSTTRINP